MHLRVAWLALVMTTACAASTDPYADHDEPADFDPVAGDGKADGFGAFDQNNVSTDAFFTDEIAIDAAGLKAFFEDSPYHNRSWLADATIDGVSAADAIVAAAQAEGLNPLVLVARMQVESSVVSKTATPSQVGRTPRSAAAAPTVAGARPATPASTLSSRAAPT